MAGSSTRMQLTRRGLLGAGLGVLLKLGGRMSVVMLLPSLALSTVTGLNVYASILLMGVVTTLYAMEGGFEAVIWTDVLQVAVTYGGVAVALFYLAGGVEGGLGGVIASGTAAGKFEAVSWDFDFTKPTMWVFVGMFWGHIFTQLADQPLMQRMLASADLREAKRTVVVGNLIGLTSSVVFFFVGTSLWAFYRAHPERLAGGVPTDAIFPYFIANELPHGVVGLIVAGIFAAAMGALSSAINATAAIVVSDFQALLRPGASAEQLYESVAAEELISARDEALGQMRQAGVAVLDTPPTAMTSALVNRYLEIKERSAL